MKPPFSADEAKDFSTLHIEVKAGEDWINDFLSKEPMIITISDQYSLTQLNLTLEEGKVTLTADIVEKEGSAICLTCLPTWDIENQRIQLDEIDIKLNSKNLILKSASWFATTFMGNKIDKKIEQSANQRYTEQIKKLVEEGISMPIQDAGQAEVLVKSITIKEMIFHDHMILINVMIEGRWKLQL